MRLKNLFCSSPPGCWTSNAHSFMSRLNWVEPESWKNIFLFCSDTTKMFADAKWRQIQLATMCIGFNFHRLVLSSVYSIILVVCLEARPKTLLFDEGRRISILEISWRVMDTPAPIRMNIVVINMRLDWKIFFLCSYRADTTPICASRSIWKQREKINEVKSRYLINGQCREFTMMESSAHSVERRLSSDCKIVHFFGCDASINSIQFNFLSSAAAAAVGCLPRWSIVKVLIANKQNLWSVNWWYHRNVHTAQLAFSYNS